VKPVRAILFLSLFTATIPLTARQKICVVAPLSGKYSAIGKRVVQAVKFQVNRDGCGLDIQAFDTMGTQDGATHALSGVSNDDNCLAVIGGVGDKTGGRVATWASIWELPVLLLSGGSIQQDEWITRLRPSRTAMFEDIAVLVVKSGLNTGFTVCSQDEFQNEACAAFARGMQNAGGSVIKRIDCTEPKECASKLASEVGGKKGPFFVFVPFPLTDAIRFYAYLNYMQVKDRFFLVGGPLLDVPALLIRRAAELDGFMFGDVFSSVLNPELAQQYRRFSSHSISTLEIWSMDSAGFVCQAYMSGANTRESMRSVFEQTKSFQGVAGGYFNTNGDEWHGPVRLFKVHGDSLDAVSIP